jgi:hypothetical protein
MRAKSQLYLAVFARKINKNNPTMAASPPLKLKEYFSSLKRSFKSCFFKFPTKIENSISVASSNITTSSKSVDEETSKSWFFKLPAEFQASNSVVTNLLNDRPSTIAKKRSAAGYHHFPEEFILSKMNKKKGPFSATIPDEASSCPAAAERLQRSSIIVVHCKEEAPKSPTVSTAKRLSSRPLSYHAGTRRSARPRHEEAPKSSADATAKSLLLRKEYSISFPFIGEQDHSSPLRLLQQDATIARRYLSSKKSYYPLAELKSVIAEAKIRLQIYNDRKSREELLSCRQQPPCHREAGSDRKSREELLLCRQQPPCHRKAGSIIYIQASPVQSRQRTWPDDLPWLDRASTLPSRENFKLQAPATKQRNWLDASSSH